MNRFMDKDFFSLLLALAFIFAMPAIKNSEYGKVMAQQSAETIGDTAFAATAAKRYDLERENTELKAKLAACEGRTSASSTKPTTDQLTEIRAQVLLRRAEKGTILKLNVDRFGAHYYAISKNEGGNAEVYAVGTRPGQILYEDNAMEQYRGTAYSRIQTSEIGEIYYPGSQEWKNALAHFVNGE